MKYLIRYYYNNMNDDFELVQYAVNASELQTELIRLELDSSVDSISYKLLK